MRALVTGASGFIGRTLAERLLAEGAALRVLARDPGRLGGLAAEAVRGDVADEAALARATAGVDVVFHVAGAFREPGLPDEAYWRTNATAVGRVIGAARRNGVRRGGHTSTVGVHRSGAGPPAAAGSPGPPGGGYEAGKA